MTSNVSVPSNLGSVKSTFMKVLKIVSKIPLRGQTHVFSSSRISEAREADRHDYPRGKSGIGVAAMSPKIWNCEAEVCEPWDRPLAFAAQLQARFTPLRRCESPIGSAGERVQRFFIRRAVVRRPSRFHAVKLKEHRALLNAGLVHLGGHSARQETPSSGGERGPSELGVSGQRIRIADRTICGDPMSFSHHGSLSLLPGLSRFSRSAYRPGE